MRICRRPRLRIWPLTGSASYIFPSADNAQRQKARLDKLTGFLENDFADDFRGAPQVTRKALGEEYSDHATVMNECIDTAYMSGFCAVCPERGIVCLALKDEREGDLEAFFSNLGMDSPMICHLNLD